MITILQTFLSKLQRLYFCIRFRHNDRNQKVLDNFLVQDLNITITITFVFSCFKIK